MCTARTFSALIAVLLLCAVVDTGLQPRPDVPDLGGEVVGHDASSCLSSAPSTSQELPALIASVDAQDAEHAVTDSEQEEGEAPQTAFSGWPVASSRLAVLPSRIGRFLVRVERPPILDYDIS